MPELGTIIDSRKLGLQSRRKSIWLQCIDCHKERWVQLTGCKPNTPDAIRCRSCAAKLRCKRYTTEGKKNPCWKGGRRITTDGYVQINIQPDNFFYVMGNKGYVFEHRLVMAKHLGRCLQSWELVHHKNGIRDDNRIENLELTTMGNHNREHSKGYRAGYQQGLQDGKDKQMEQLKLQLKLLSWRILELEKKLEEQNYTPSSLH